jgi:hypothetical protein
MDSFHKKTMMQNFMGQIQQKCPLKQVFICLHITATALGCVFLSKFNPFRATTAVLNISIKKEILKNQIPISNGTPGYIL